MTETMSMTSVQKKSQMLMSITVAKMAQLKRDWARQAIIFVVASIKEDYPEAQYVEFATSDRDCSKCGCACDSVPHSGYVYRIYNDEQTLVYNGSEALDAYNGDRGLLEKIDWQDRDWFNGWDRNGYPARGTDWNALHLDIEKVLADA